MSDEQLSEIMQASLKERDGVTSRAAYLEALRRAGDSATFNESLGLSGGPAYQALSAYHEANPSQAEHYRRWQQARTNASDPAKLLLEGMHRKAGPRKEASDTIGEGSEFLADLFGNRR